jgi:hypothetical protein
MITSYKNAFRRNEYTHFTVGPGQVVKVFGEVVVLFYRQRKLVPAPTPAILLNQTGNTPRSTSATAQPHHPINSPKLEPHPTQPNSLSAPQTMPLPNATPSTPEIRIRLQISSSGHFSTACPRSVIRPQDHHGRIFYLVRAPNIALPSQWT